MECARISWANVGGNIRSDPLQRVKVDLMGQGLLRRFPESLEVGVGMLRVIYEPDGNGAWKATAASIRKQHQDEST